MQSTVGDETQKISKKSWNPNEDKLLLNLINEYGLNGSWSIISGKMGNRTGKQCRERYHNHLKSGISKIPWTKDEDELLNHSQQVLGNQWAKIAKLLPGRSDNSVKNRWHIINRHNKDVAPVVAAATTTKKKMRPAVPKLSLATLHQLPATETAATSCQMKLTTTGSELDEAVEEDLFDDLMSHFYSHNSHSHEMTMSSRTSRNNSGREPSTCLGSGRRDMNVTSAGSSEDALTASYNNYKYKPAASNSARARCVSEENIEQELLLQSMQLGFLSFNNTLNSNISELTAPAGEFCCEDFDDDEDPLANSARSNDAWIDQIGRIVGGTTTAVDLTTFSPRLTSDFPCNSAIQKMAREFSNLEQLDLDRFSEPAVSFRETPEDIDEFANALHMGEEKATECTTATSSGASDLGNVMSSYTTSQQDLMDAVVAEDDNECNDILLLDCFEETAGVSCGCASGNSFMLSMFSPLQQQQQLSNKQQKKAADMIGLLPLHQVGKGAVALCNSSHARMTPRSPAFPAQVKRQRGGATPRSPFKVY